MNRTERIKNRNEIFSDPKIKENYALLQDIGVLDHIDFLEKEINNYKNLFAGALDIVNRATIGEIMDAAVWQISDNFLPSFIVFIWKPIQNREDITIKCYKNYKLVDLNLKVDSLSVFEPFFLKHSNPVYYGRFASEIGKNAAIISLNMIEPELVIPILGPSGLYGLVLLGRNIQGEDYTVNELAFIQNLMSFVSKAIQNHLHYERTLRDPKTGLYNNGFFMTRLDEELARTKRMNTETSIIIIDVDKFKDFNDIYGHLAGDRVLESLAITIKQGVRLGDIPSRFGGEEFTVLLPDSGREMAWVAAERLRTMVKNMKVTWEPPLPQVTISLGVYTFEKSTNILAEEIIKRADEALYMSKERGRNRTSVWGAGLYHKIKRMKENDKTFKD
jgi:diguanylate cyclase (GGDEF)-like protein